MCESSTGLSWKLKFLVLLIFLWFHLFSIWSCAKKYCSYGRVGLRRQIKVLVRKGVGSNPTVNNAPLSQEDAARAQLPTIAQLVERRTVELQRSLGHWFESGWSESLLVEIHSVSFEFCLHIPLISIIKAILFRFPSHLKRVFVCRT